MTVAETLFAEVNDDLYPVSEYGDKRLPLIYINSRWSVVNFVQSNSQKTGTKPQQVEEEQTRHKLLDLCALDPNYSLLKWLEQHDFNGFLSKDKDGNMPLHVAASQGDLLALRHIIRGLYDLYSHSSNWRQQLDDDLYALASDGRTPLMKVIDADASNNNHPNSSLHLRILSLLLDLSGDVQRTDGEGMNSAMYAAKMGRLEMLKLLVSRGVAIQPPMDRKMRSWTDETFSKKTAIGIACQSGHLEVVRWLYETAHAKISFEPLCKIISQIERKACQDDDGGKFGLLKWVVGLLLRREDETEAAKLEYAWRCLRQVFENAKTEQHELNEFLDRLGTENWWDRHQLLPSLIQMISSNLLPPARAASSSYSSKSSSESSESIEDIRERAHPDVEGKDCRLAFLVRGNYLCDSDLDPSASHIVLDTDWRLSMAFRACISSNRPTYLQMFLNRFPGLLDSFVSTPIVRQACVEWTYYILRTDNELLIDHWVRQCPEGVSDLFEMHCAHLRRSLQLRSDRSFEALVRLATVYQKIEVLKMVSAAMYEELVSLPPSLNPSVHYTKFVICITSLLSVDEIKASITQAFWLNFVSKRGYDVHLPVVWSKLKGSVQLVPEGQEAFGCSLIALCIAHNQLTLVRHFVEDLKFDLSQPKLFKYSHFDMYAGSDDTNVPASFLATLGSAQMLEYVLDHGAPIMGLAKYMSSKANIVQRAAMLGSKKSLEIIKSRVSASEWNSILHDQAFWNHIHPDCGASLFMMDVNATQEVISFLLSEGASFSPANLALIDCHDTWNTILDHGMSVDTPFGTERQSKLCQCVSFGDADLASLLLSRGASKNFTDANGRTPRQIAIANGYNDLVFHLNL